MKTARSHGTSHHGASQHGSRPHGSNHHGNGHHGASLLATVLVKFHDQIPPGWGIERIDGLLGPAAGAVVEPLYPDATDADLVSVFTVTLPSRKVLPQALAVLRAAPDVEMAEAPGGRPWV